LDLAQAFSIAERCKPIAKSNECLKFKGYFLQASKKVQYVFSHIKRYQTCVGIVVSWVLYLRNRQFQAIVIPSCGYFRKQWYPQIIHFNRVFHYKPSILGYPMVSLFLGTSMSYSLDPCERDTTCVSVPTSSTSAPHTLVLKAWGRLKGGQGPGVSHMDP